ncbi:MAG: CopD family protein, partial [Gallionellaceae bacterium]
MLWIKAFHIIFVTSWFAGLFYLPRIFVNLAMVNSEQERSRLLLMSHKLYRFVTPIGALALVFGTWLWLGYGFAGAWLHIKLLLVLVLIAYHF